MKLLDKIFASNRVMLPLILIGAALSILLIGKVLMFGGNNVHSHMQYWSSLNLMIQSNDPSYPATRTRASDIRDMAALLWPRSGSNERATAIYDSWRNEKDWATTKYSLVAFELSDEKDRAVAVHEIHARYAPEAPDPGAPILERTEHQNSVWLKRGRHWYLSEQTRTVDGVVEKPFRGVITP